MRKTFSVLIILLVALSALFVFAGCHDDPPVVEKEKDYNVGGLWQANYSWIEDSPYNYGGNKYSMTIYFNFRDDGTLLSKRRMSINNHVIEDSFSQWTIVNLATRNVN